MYNQIGVSLLIKKQDYNFNAFDWFTNYMSDRLNFIQEEENNEYFMICELLKDPATFLWQSV